MLSYSERSAHIAILNWMSGPVLSSAGGEIGEVSWRSLFEQLSEGFFIADMVRDATGRVVDWRFVEMNQAWELGSGLKRAAARGRTVSEVIPGIEPIWIENFARVADSGQPLSFVQSVYDLHRNYEVRAFPVTADRIAVLFVEVSARDRADARRVALLELSDRIRELQDPDDIAYTTAEVLARTLGVSRAGYGEVDLLSETIAIARDWNAPGISSIAGVLQFRDYGSYIENLKRGETVVVADAYEDPRTRDMADALRAISAISFVNMAVSEQGGLVALLYLNHAVAREWTAEELEFIRDAAERTRQAVERRRAEQSLRGLAASLEQTVAARTRERDRVWRNALDLIVIVDTAGVFRQVNPAVTRLLGWTAGQLIGRTFLELVVSDDAQTTEEALAQATHTQLAAFANRYRHQDGSTRWISWVAAAEGDLIYAHGRDISAEKTQAEALERAQARLRAIFETSYQLQGLLDLDGTLIDANATSLAAIDAELADVVGTQFWATPWFARTGGMPDKVRAAVQAAAAGIHSRMEVAVNLPSGARFYDFSLRPIRGADDRVVSIVHEAVDITQRQLAEEQLRQAQKMEAVGQLTGGLAHDFNNLLTGISGSLEMLQGRLAQGKFGSVDRYLSAAQGAAKRAAALTHRLLAFSRRQTLDPKSTDVNRLVADMEEMIRRTVGPGIQLEVIGAGGLWATIIDPNQLENSLLNLCINARDAMPNGGRITIETGNIWLDERAASERDLPPGQYVSLCVTDTGTGMTADVVSRAFDPFFTTKPLGEGTGLGLSMVYGFARQSGGQVRIYSEVGEGSTMCLYLPRDRAGPVAEPPLVSDSRRDLERGGAAEVVLVVDDEPTIRMLVTEVLQDFGYASIEAPDGPTGLKVLQSTAKIDLLITDVGLPGGINGRQVADAARSLRPGLKVLFITGYAENAVVGNGHLDPGMQVLTKPFAMEALARRIKELVEG
jgi:PAS domain S-box-containing protein